MKKPAEGQRAGLFTQFFFSGRRYFIASSSTATRMMLSVAEIQKRRFQRVTSAQGVKPSA